MKSESARQYLASRRRYARTQARGRAARKREMKAADLRQQQQDRVIMGMVHEVKAGPSAKRSKCRDDAR
jgi:hypothetical protein